MNSPSRFVVDNSTKSLCQSKAISTHASLMKIRQKLFTLLSQGRCLVHTHCRLKFENLLEHHRYSKPSQLLGRWRGGRFFLDLSVFQDYRPSGRRKNPIDLSVRQEVTLRRKFLGRSLCPYYRTRAVSADPLSVGLAFGIAHKHLILGTATLRIALNRIRRLRERFQGGFWASSEGLFGQCPSTLPMIHRSPPTSGPRCVAWQF
jgi:hypothetical protein